MVPLPARTVRPRPQGLARKLGREAAAGRGPPTTQGSPGGAEPRDGPTLRADPGRRRKHLLREGDRVGRGWPPSSAVRDSERSALRCARHPSPRATRVLGQVREGPCLPSNTPRRHHQPAPRTQQGRHPGGPRVPRRTDEGDGKARHRQPHQPRSLRPQMVGVPGHLAAAGVENDPSGGNNRRCANEPERAQSRDLIAGTQPTPIPARSYCIHGACGRRRPV